MQKILRLYGSILLSLLTVNTFSQGEIDEQQKIMLRNEKTGIVFLTSNGIGVGYRYGKRINARNQTMYDFDFMNVKHPKELRLTSNYNYYSSRTFIFGKQNNFYELKGSIGKQYVMYRKNDKGGIAIRYFYTLGPTIGVLKPIYYEIHYVTALENYTKIEKFDVSIHQQNINGKASFFKGFDELSIVPGASAKLGFNFEFSREDAQIRALEIGVGLDLFPKSIPIMAEQPNNFYFLNLTIGYRFGKVIDVSDAAIAAKNRKDTRAEKKLSRNLSKDSKNNSNELQNF